MNQSLRDHLIAKQTAERLTGREMARRLGISEGHWSHICAVPPRRGLSKKVIRRALRLYPDLQLAFLNELVAPESEVA